MASLIKAHEDAAELDVCSKLLMMVALFSNGLSGTPHYVGDR
jgi:hypothetical protein